ncbi:hypothetical protein [Microbacterium rhizophilus]|uniref:hypothetical protein n=1 Tax=Microbacterium rhizophilus TaxID=3138934 RepID=UPI0031ECF1DF
MTYIWGTRGRAWGFTFLTTAGLEDPLRDYEIAMAPLEGAASGYARVGDVVALKFPDPEGRHDRAGRAVSHSFVLYGALAERVGSLEDGVREVWPLVADEYAQVWDLPMAPLASG